MTSAQLLDRYRFNFRYHLAIGGMVLGLLLMYWFGVLVPAYQTNRYDIWLLILLLIVLFYLNFLYCWPWAIRSDMASRCRVAAIVVLSVVITDAMALLISVQFGDLSVNFAGFDLAALWSLFDGSVPNFYAYLLLPALINLGFSYTTYYIELTHGPFANRKTWLKELSDLRMAWRRAQLDPHLLDMHLVVLSAITRQSKVKAQQALDYTIRVVHFHIGGNDPGEQIRLADEIETVRSLLAIQRLRLGSKMTWHINVGKGLEQIAIMPMTVMVFAENQVRFAVLDNPAAPAVLEVGLRGGDLFMKARNRIRGIKARQGSGTGMANLQERLEASYAGRFQLHARVVGDWYEAQLTIHNIFA